MKECKGMKANKRKGTEKQNQNKSSVTAWPTQHPWEVRWGWVLHGFQGTPGHLGGLVYRLITSLEYPGGTFPSEILSKLGWITWEVLYVNLKVKNYNGSPKYLLVFFLLCRRQLCCEVKCWDNSICHFKALRTKFYLQSQAHIFHCLQWK